MFNKKISSLLKRLVEYQTNFKSAVGVANLTNNSFRIPGGIEGVFTPISTGEKAVMGQVSLQLWRKTERENHVVKTRRDIASLVFITNEDASNRCPLLNGFESNFYTTAFLSWVCEGWKFLNETTDEVVFAILAPMEPPVVLATVSFKKGEVPVLQEPVVNSAVCADLLNPSNPKGLLREKVEHYMCSLLDVPRHIFDEKAAIAAKNLSTKEVEVILPKITIDPF